MKGEKKCRQISFFFLVLWVFSHHTFNFCEHFYSFTTSQKTSAFRYKHTHAALRTFLCITAQTKNRDDTQKRDYYSQTRRFCGGGLFFVFFFLFGVREKKKIHPPSSVSSSSSSKSPNASSSSSSSEKVFFPWSPVVRGGERRRECS